MKLLKSILTMAVLSAVLLIPGFADEVRYQFDQNFPQGAFSLANWRATNRALSQGDSGPLKASAKHVLDPLEYGTSPAATAEYAGTGVTITTDAVVFQEGTYALKAVTDGTNNRSFARTYSINLSSYPKITLWQRSTATSSAIQFYLSDGTNSSYWDITTSGSAGTWVQTTLTLASPNSNSGSPASLSAITSYGFRLLDASTTYYFDTIKATSGMNVSVRGTNLGSYYRHAYLGVQPIVCNAQVSPTITAPAANPRIDILVMDSACTLSYVTGTEAGSPAIPWASMPTNKIPIALIYNKTTETKIVDYEDQAAFSSDGYIYADVRPFLNLGGGNWIKGADVASTASMTLGNDGNMFDITGTTGITSITARPAGQCVYLQFDGILTVTDGSNLKLNGNFVTAAESTLILCSDGTNWFEFGRQPTASTFLGLTDTPSSYSGQGLKGVRVNSGATALEFFTRNFLGLGDVPASFSGAAGKVARVNSGETALEFADTARSELFTSSGTFTAPAGVTKVYLTGAAGGGAGGGTTNSGSNGAAGGGGGASWIKRPYAVTPGNGYTVTIGAGGTGVSQATGNTGGTTSFDAISLAGGLGGSNVTAGGVGGGGLDGATGTGGAAGTGSIKGGTGGVGQANQANSSGGGGSTPFAAGPAGRTTDGVGTAGTANTGCGGAGSAGGAGNQPGGAGGSGFIFVEW